MNTVFNLSWRLFRHEARRGELTIILAAIVLSVAAVLSLSLFSERLQSALVQRTSEFMAADRVLDTRNIQVPVEWIAYAQDMGIDTASAAYTRSMAFANEKMTLVDFRAVSSAYPLKGKVKVAEQPFQLGEVTVGIPDRGETWVESRLFQSLGIALGDSIEVGDGIFKVTKVLVEVPDAGFGVFNTEPKVLINLADFASTNVAGPGSRVSYTYFYAGDNGALEEYYQWLKPQLDFELHDWDSIEDDGSAIGEAVRTAEQYFLLASLLAIVLAAVSIAVAAQRYSQRHYDPVAIMKTLGAGKKMVQQVYLMQIIFITGLGLLLGCAAGFLIQQAVVWALSDSVEVSIDMWHWRPLVIAIFTGVICSLLFSLYPLLKLFSVPPLRVLRRDLGATVSSRLIQFLAAGGAIFLLMWAYSQNLRISAILFVSGIVLVAGLIAVTYGLIALGRRLGQGNMSAWQLAWARIRRRAMDNSVQLISFSITIMLLLVVLVMRNDMIKQWQEQLPQGTPNYFLVNITETQLPTLKQHFEANNVAVEDFFPVVRGRFVAVNDEKIRTSVSKEDDEEDTRGRNALGREANITWSNKLQVENTVVEGLWFSEHQPEQPYGVSVEKEIAGRLDIKLGDKLTFNIGSQVVDVVVTSLREVNWQTMQPNFFFIIQPEAMREFSPTYLTSFHLTSERKQEITELMRPFGSVTMFDVEARINQLRDIVSQVSMAVEFILILVLVAGSLVLIAQVQASMDERQQELAILRTLGAKGGLIRASVVYEFLIIGIVSGLMAAIANEGSLFLLQTQVFQMPASLHLEYWVLAPVAGATVVGILGALGCWRLLALNTSQLLRQMV